VTELTALTDISALTEVHATVFDLDDTLVDSGGLWDTTCREFSLRRGRAWTAADAAAIHGSAGWNRYLAEVAGDGLSPQQVFADCTEAMIATVHDGRMRMLDGARDLLTCAAAHGPVGIASAAPRRYVHAVLSAFGIAELFTVVVCNEDVERSKPHPEPYLAAAGGLGIDPTYCLAVEDSSTGLRSARAAGMPVLLVPSHHAPVPGELSVLADHQAASTRHAVAVLRSLVMRPEALPAGTPS